MDEQSEYRVLGKSRAVALFAALSALGAGALWMTLRAIESRTREILEAPGRMTEHAQTDVGALIDLFAWVLAGPLIALAAFVAWTGYRGLAARALPPPGSWIIEGQRIRRGDDAVRASRYLIAMSVVIALMGVFLVVLIHWIARQLQ